AHAFDQKIAPALTRRLTPVAATVGGGLIGNARMVRAIGQSCDRVAAAEEEFRAAGIANRPSTGLLGQFQNGAALTDRDDVLDEFRGGFHLDLVGMRERRVAANGAASDPQHVRRRACFALPWGGAGRSFGASGEAKPMDLSDDCVAGNAAEFGSDLTG